MRVEATRGLRRRGAEGDGCSLGLQGCEASTSVGRAIMRDELGVEVAVDCSCCVVAVLNCGMAVAA